MRPSSTRTPRRCVPDASSRGRCRRGASTHASTATRARARWPWNGSAGGRDGAPPARGGAGGGGAARGGGGGKKGGGGGERGRPALGRAVKGGPAPRPPADLLR